MPVTVAMSRVSSLISTLPPSARPKRPHVVWASLMAGMTLVGGLMLLTEPKPAGSSPAALPPVAAMLDQAHPSGPPRDLIGASVPLDPQRWAGIVIHHSGSTMGSADSMARLHEAAGLKSLGYHFVIGNGQGAPDGQVTTGPRWLNQLSGAHAKGPASEALNRRTIGICLVGDGESKGFTDAQQAALVQLVAQLQRKFNIPASAVVLHRDVAPTVSPGRLFPEAAFRARLADVR